MKIIVAVEKRTFGHVEVEVPENSKILDPDASVLVKRKAAKELAEDHIRKNKNAVVWMHDSRDVSVSLGYYPVDE